MGKCSLLAGSLTMPAVLMRREEMGNEDDRALWPRCSRVIIECRPRWVVAENVRIVDMALDGVLSDPENQRLRSRDDGYSSLRRQWHLWIVAYSKINRMERPEDRKIGGFTQGRMDAIGEGEVIGQPHSARLEGRNGEELRERTVKTITFQPQRPIACLQMASMSSRGSLNPYCRVDDGLPEGWTDISTKNQAFHESPPEFIKRQIAR